MSLLPQLKFFSFEIQFVNSIFWIFQGYVCCVRLKVYTQSRILNSFFFGPTLTLGHFNVTLTLKTNFRLRFFCSSLSYSSANALEALALFLYYLQCSLFDGLID